MSPPPPDDSAILSITLEREYRSGKSSDGESSIITTSVICVEVDTLLDARRCELVIRPRRAADVSGAVNHTSMLSYRTSNHLRLLLLPSVCNYGIFR